MTIIWLDQGKNLLLCGITHCLFLLPRHLPSLTSHSVLPGCAQSIYVWVYRRVTQHPVSAYVVRQTLYVESALCISGLLLGMEILLRVWSCWRACSLNCFTGAGKSISTPQDLFRSSGKLLNMTYYCIKAALTRCNLFDKKLYGFVVEYV